MTYPCKRRFDIRSTGQWLYKNPGRPDMSNSRQWRETSNFVLNVVAKVVPCEGYATENGWLIDIYASGKTISDLFVSVDIASSNLALRKHLMKAFAGCICQLMSIDFLDFVDMWHRKSYKSGIQCKRHWENNIGSRKRMALPKY